MDCCFCLSLYCPVGGFLARTDSCHAPEAVTVSANNSNVSSRNSSCRLQLSEVSVRNNSARAAGGVLITNIRPEVVVLLNCSSGSALRRDTLPCLEAHNALTHQLTGWSSSPSAGRSLLQQQQQSGDASAAAGSGGDPGANTAVSGYGNFLLTSAAGVRCQNMVRRGAAGDTEEALWLDDDCAQPIMAPPGQPFGRSFVLLDGLGDPISSGIYDAHMPMAVSGKLRRGWGAVGDCWSVWSLPACCTATLPSYCCCLFVRSHTSTACPVCACPFAGKCRSHQAGRCALPYPWQHHTGACCFGVHLSMWVHWNGLVQCQAVICVLHSHTEFSP